MHGIRTRLFAAILLAALVPAVPAALLVNNLLQRSRDASLERHLVDGLEAGMEESRLALAASREALVRAGEDLAAGRAAGVVILDADGRLAPQLAPPAAVLDAARRADPRPQPVDDWLVMRRANADGDDLTLVQPLPAGLADRAGRLADALATAAALRLDRGAILRGYVAPFLLIYAALLLAALGLAALLARGVVGPLHATARAADRLAAGDLDARVGADGPGEVGALVRAFDGMAERLGAQRRELARLEKLAAWRGMSRILAHEIKNPLTPILLAVQEARGSYRGGDAAHAAVLADCETIVREEVEGLRRLVASFADFARLPAPEPRDDDLRPLLDDLDRLYGERLLVEAAAGPLPGRFDAEALRRALINLIDNGLGACARAGRPERVRLRAASAAGALVVSVADEGDGIPPENLERVFDPDFSTRGGMGLGLAIVRGVVEGHDGSVSLESMPGRGTTATVRLPTLPQEAR
ncbi:MAG: HAMP domain-containing protein [bacterium]|nr:HAMP domain-containing protein [bacterium]